MWMDVKLTTLWFFVPDIYYEYSGNNCKMLKKSFNRPDKYFHKQNTSKDMALGILSVIVAVADYLVMILDH